MKSWMPAVPITVCDRDGSFGLYWVVGDHATSRCEIVTRNPVVIGDIWFEDGPYGPLNDAKLTRSTTGACPKTTGVPADQSLVQNAIAAYAVGHRRIDLLKFGLQLLVDQQQCFQRAADVTVATGHNLVDGGFFWFRSHRKSFNCPVR
jgi:hypothetical protein